MERLSEKRQEVYEMNPTSMLELANRYLNDPQFKERMGQVLMFL
jgi:hypothetical protein